MNHQSDFYEEEMKSLAPETIKIFETRKDEICLVLPHWTPEKSQDLLRKTFKSVSFENGVNGKF